MTAVDAPTAEQADRTTTRHTWRGPRPRVAHGRAFDPGPWRHMHRIPGVWDDDNARIGGMVCGDCWDAGRQVSVAAIDRQ